VQARHHPSPLCLRPQPPQRSHAPGPPRPLLSRLAAFASGMPHAFGVIGASPVRCGSSISTCHRQPNQPRDERARGATTMATMATLTSGDLWGHAAMHGFVDISIGLHLGNGPRAPNRATLLWTRSCEGSRIISDPPIRPGARIGRFRACPGRGYSQGPFVGIGGVVRPVCA
jgi:hypothetical protein